VTDSLTETVPELTPEQYALLEALRDVAVSPEAQAAKYATEQLARLAGEAFGYPLPAPVVREGGLAGFFYGNPIRPGMKDQLSQARAATGKARASGGTVDPKRLALVGGAGAAPGSYDDEVIPASPWPFKPGTVVRDEEGAEVEWLDTAPEGVVVRGEIGAEWTRTKTGWSGQTSEWIAQFAPLTVVSVPDSQEACTDDAPDSAS